MRKQLNIGDKFGRLTVTGQAPPDKRGKTQCVCVCECGTLLTSGASQLRSGNTTSCGCFKDEVTAQRSRTHGMSGTSEYTIWASMVQRCTNPSSTAFSSYGGRGITVCARWQESFENFYADMGARPTGLSLDRVDNDGNYEPGNVEWATQKTQRRNTRINKVLQYKGQVKSMAEWCELLGVNYRRVSARLRLGWTVQEAFEGGPYSRANNSN